MKKIYLEGYTLTVDNELYSLKDVTVTIEGLFGDKFILCGTKDNGDIEFAFIFSDFKDALEALCLIGEHIQMMKQKDEAFAKAVDTVRDYCKERGYSKIFIPGKANNALDGFPLAYRNFGTKIVVEKLIC